VQGGSSRHRYSVEREPLFFHPATYAFAIQQMSNLKLYIDVASDISLAFELYVAMYPNTMK
jgi:hypothetical protein